MPGKRGSERAAMTLAGVSPAKPDIAQPMNTLKHEYRCTRNQPYTEHTELSAREGHYIEAESEFDALIRMGKKFPNDTAGFTATLYKERSYASVIPSDATKEDIEAHLRGEKDFPEKMVVETTLSEFFPR